MKDEAHSSDGKFCLGAVDLHKKTFGAVPETYGFDQSGYSKSIIKKLKRKGVKHVGVAPKGLAPWEVSKAGQKRRTCERGPSRRMHWVDKTRQIWLQQTGCKKRRVNGGL